MSKQVPGTSKTPEKNLPPISGYLHRLSGLKRSSKGSFYYEGCLQTSEQGTVKIVGFSPLKRRKLLAFKNRDSAVKLLPFSVRHDPEETYLVSDRGPVDGVKVEFQKKSELDYPQANLQDLSSQVGVDVSVKAKVVSVEPAVQKSNYKVQEVTVKNGETAIDMLLYEGMVDRVEVAHSYQFDGVRVQEGQTHYFSSTTNTDINELTTAIQVVGDSVPASMKKLVFCGVLKIGEARSCPSCEVGIVEKLDDDDELVTCTTCQMTSLSSMSTTKISATANYKDSSNKMLTLKIDSNTLPQLPSELKQAVKFLAANSPCLVKLDKHDSITIFEANKDSNDTILKKFGEMMDSDDVVVEVEREMGAEDMVEKKSDEGPGTVEKGIRIRRNEDSITIFEANKDSNDNILKKSGERMDSDDIVDNVEKEMGRNEDMDKKSDKGPGKVEKGIRKNEDTVGKKSDKASGKGKKK